nr:hypothetical protein DM860_017600 [Ipomoea batatas]
MFRVPDLLSPGGKFGVGNPSQGAQPGEAGKSRPGFVPVTINAMEEDIHLEVSNPATFSGSRCRRFNRWLENEDLVDLGFFGPEFTWTRGNNVETFRGSRHDKVICSTDWLDFLLGTHVQHLPKINNEIGEKSTRNAHEEVKNALFEMAPYKAPSLYGFHVGFF